jgi:hypothetical protein
VTRRAVCVAIVAATASRASADERPAVHLELGACLDGEREPLERAVRLELGKPADDATTVDVAVDCAVGGVDAGLVIEVRSPRTARRYRYALDWHAQPIDARPRLAGLAVVEAVDASQIELTAIAEPAPVAPPALRVEASPWAVAVGPTRRAFAGGAGVALVGGGVGASRAVSSHVRVAIDLVVEGDTVVVASGAIAVQSMSSSPRLVYRVGDRVHAELGVGARVGAVMMRGEPLAGGALEGRTFARPWAGPAASLGAGISLTRALALDATVELGTAMGATARDLSGQPAAMADGRWTAFGMALNVSL